MTMKFNYEGTEQLVNVNEVFVEATCDDFVDFIDAFGVVVHNLPSNLNHGETKVMIVYDDIKDVVSIEIIINEDEYVWIKERQLEMSKEERELIVKQLSAV